MTPPATSERDPLASRPPEVWHPLHRLARKAARPLERFLRVQAASGILLLLAATAALVWANSPWAHGYHAFWHAPIELRAGPYAFDCTPEWIVNDGLMVLFFFVVGMEIRREIHDGELSEWRRAAVPFAAALGGMLAPALVYLGIAGAPDTHSGWGVPMATDIAFAVGVLTLFGKRVPPPLRVLLLALAVIDDLGAILVIAVFYSSGVAVSGLVVAALAIVGILVMQRIGVRAKAVYVIPALVAWASVYSAGIHPTIAGVVVGLVTPVRAWLGPEGFFAGVQHALSRRDDTAPSALPNRELTRTLRKVDLARREAVSPAESLVEALHPWVAFGIMPLFALANAGVSLADTTLHGSGWRVLVGVAAGLVVGKPLGVLLAIGLALKLRIGVLPTGLTMRHVVVLGIIAGIGFTMSLFIAQLAFVDAELLGAAKLGILAASGAAGVAAVAACLLLLRQPASDEAASEPSAAD